jgi:hypothetical protein
MEIDLGPRIGTGIYDCLEHALSVVDTNDTMALEFGVATGTTLNRIAEVMPVVGFDSFDGLPERWREGFEKGMFAQAPPKLNPNASLTIGLFGDTLPTFSPYRSVSLIHIDCDLYSSTVMVLWHLMRWIEHGALAETCYIVFDEFHSYAPDWARTGEAKAWEEFLQIADYPGLCSIVGHGPEQLVIKMENKR